MHWKNECIPFCIKMPVFKGDLKSFRVLLTCLFGVLFFTISPQIGMSQDSIAKKEPVIWHKFEGNIGMTVNQLAITHWAAGGESNMSGKASAFLKYTYNR